MTTTTAPRILITSNAHQHYDQTATVIEDHGDHLIVELSDGQQCQVDNGQFKVIKQQS
jgi:hypothetical protein